MKAKWIALVVAAFLLLPMTLAGCGQYTQDDLNTAHQQGYDAGFDAGVAPTPQDINDAYDQGYETGYDTGEDWGYGTGYRDGESFGYSKGRDDAIGSCAALAQDNYDQGYYEGYEDCLNGYSDYYEELGGRSLIPGQDTSDFFIDVVSVTTPVNRGGYATLKARAIPGALCGITVYYASGKSEAEGLYPQRADDEGSVSWTWRVGTNTTPGFWKIVVTAYNIDDWFSETPFISDEIYFEVQ